MDTFHAALIYLYLGEYDWITTFPCRSFLDINIDDAYIKYVCNMDVYG